MLDLRDDHFGRAIDGVPLIPRVFGEIDIGKGRVIHAAAFLCRRGRLHHHIFVRLYLLFRQTVVKGAFDIHDIGRVLVFQTDEQRLVHGNAQAALFVKRGERLFEVVFQLLNGICLFRKTDVLLRARERERRKQLLQYVRFVRLIRMEFEAEFAQSQPVQTLFDDRKGRLLFRDEQDALAVVQSIGDDIGDGLALARSRRAVEDEGFARLRQRHRLPLRGIGGKGHQRLRGRTFVFLEFDVLNVLDLAAVIEKGGDQLVLGEYVHIAAKILPHLIARERERRHVHVVEHLPILHIDDLHADHRQNFGYF